MSYLKRRVDRYLMRFHVKSMLNYSQNECSGTGRDVSFCTGRDGVNVCVTNRLETPMTSNHLQSVALSIPGLYARFQQFPANKSLYHCGQLQIYRLPSAALEGDSEELSNELLPVLSFINDGEAVSSFVALQSGSGTFMEVSPTADSDTPSQISDADDFYTCSSPDTESSEAADSDAFRSACGTLPSLSHWLLEKVSVVFKGQRYLRLLTPMKHRDEDVEASWVVTDFTEAGELVLSLCLDFIWPL